MYSINELKDIIGVSEGTLYNRLSQFSEFVSEEVRKGDHNKNLITENGRKILERIEELRSQNYSIKQIKTKLGEELENTDKEQVSTTSNQSQEVSRVRAREREGIEIEAETKVNDLLRDQISILQNQMETLKDQLERKDEQIDRLQQIIQNRLPPSQEEARRKVESMDVDMNENGNRSRNSKSLWRRFKRFVKGNGYQ